MDGNISIHFNQESQTTKNGEYIIGLGWLFFLGWWWWYFHQCVTAVCILWLLIFSRGWSQRRERASIISWNFYWCCFHILPFNLGISRKFTSNFPISYQKALNHQEINKENYDRNRGTGFYGCSLAWAGCGVLCSNKHLIWALIFQVKYRRNSKQGHSDLQGLGCSFPLLCAFANLYLSPTFIYMKLTDSF